MTIEIITDATGGTKAPAIVAALILLATASLLPALLAYFWGEKKPIAAAMNILCIVTGITFGLYLLTLFILTTHKLISTL